MIKIFGLGAGGLKSLSLEAREELNTCQSLFGGARHLDLMPEGPDKHPWPKPWRLPLEDIEKISAKQQVGVLVSGDPSWFSAASDLMTYFDCQVWPVPGAFSLAAARLGWPMEQVMTGSIHGRDVMPAVAALQAGGRHLILSDRKSLRALLDAFEHLAFTPVERLTVLSHLGGGDEAIYDLNLDAPILPETDLFTLAADVAIPPRLMLDADFLPDSAFESHGKITKFSARSLAVAALGQADILWDVGAGAGTVGLQAAYTLQTQIAYFIEGDQKALKVLERNCANTSAACVMVDGQAPTALADLPAPDAVFIGGGLSDPQVLHTCWQALQPGGRLVAHAVTLESEAVLLDFFAAHPGAHLNRHHLSTAQAVGDLHGWRPAMPLTQLVIEKA